jgi:hypothetical protein
MKYQLAKGRLKVRDIRAMESGDYGATISIMAACMTDDEGKPLEFGDALERLDDMTLEQLDAELSIFEQALSEVEKSAVPLARNGRSFRR